MASAVMDLQQINGSGCMSLPRFVPVIEDIGVIRHDLSVVCRAMSALLGVRSAISALQFDGYPKYPTNGVGDL